jgi:hypothetical protein
MESVPTAPSSGPGLYGCHPRPVNGCVRDMLETLNETPNALRLGGGITSRLQAMQERLGIPGPDLNSLHTARRPRPRKAV